MFSLAIQYHLCPQTLYKEMQGAVVAVPFVCVFDVHQYTQLRRGLGISRTHRCAPVAQIPTCETRVSNKKIFLLEMFRRLPEHHPGLGFLCKQTTESVLILKSRRTPTIVADLTNLFVISSAVALDAMLDLKLDDETLHNLHQDVFVNANRDAGFRPGRPNDHGAFVRSMVLQSLMGSGLGPRIQHLVGDGGTLHVFGGGGGADADAGLAMAQALSFQLDQPQPQPQRRKRPLPSNWNTVLKDPELPESKDDPVCMTCCEYQPTICFVPCNHQLLCDQCVKRMWEDPTIKDECPLCPGDEVTTITRPILPGKNKQAKK